jgi:hypothetical protein
LIATASTTTSTSVPSLAISCVTEITSFDVSSFNGAVVVSVVGFVVLSSAELCSCVVSLVTSLVEGSDLFPHPHDE